MPVHDVWVIHPNLPPFPASMGRDRVDLLQLNLPQNSTASRIRNICEDWWGGDWPGSPVGRVISASKGIGRGDLSTFTFQETPRSDSDKGASREFIIYPSAVTLDEALALISPSRVRY